MKHTYTKKEALRIIIATAKQYAVKLEGLNYLFIYRDRSSNHIEYFETVFLPRNYQHLTGIDFLDVEGNLRRNSRYFYQKCLDNTLTEDEIRFKEDGDYFVPSSCLLEDIRKLGDAPSQILAIMSKKADRSESIYKEIRYVAKGVPLNRLKISFELSNLISLEKYLPKD